MFYHINIGSNLGDRIGNIKRAVEALVQGQDGFLISSVHESEPWGFNSDKPFLNIAVAVWSDLEPLDMLHRCQAIERSMGSEQHRNEQGGYIDRVIDIDIILVDEMVINTPELTVPHPRMHEREFVMKPLQEILNIINNKPT